MFYSHPHCLHTQRDVLIINTHTVYTDRETHTNTHTHKHKTLSHKFKTLGLECENRAIFAKTRKPDPDDDAKNALAPYYYMERKGRYR